MRHAIFAALLVLAGCGTWSNEDLEYLYALPQREELKSQLESSTTQKPLAVGDPSKTYDTVKAQSDAFNAFIDGVLTGLDTIRTFPPTTRARQSRTWGPYRDEKNKGFEAKVEIVRSADKTYTWSLQYRPIGGDFFTIAGGDFTPTESLRKGEGRFFLDAKLVRETLGGGQPEDPDRADFRYVTAGDPVQVEIDFTKGVAMVGYAFNGYADKSAVLSYLVVNPRDLNASKARYSASWNAKTAGRADFVILEGKYALGTGVECWSDVHTVQYAQFYDDTGKVEIGNQADCIMPIELKPVP